MLYKYLEEKYLDQFFDSGLIKVGTLYEYRDVEKLGFVIGDDEEGVQTTKLEAPKRKEIDLSQNSPEAAYFKRHILRPDQQDINTKIVMESGASLITRSNSPDYYIYCMTSEYDKKVMQEFNCDSCFQIVFPNGFFQAISEQIEEIADFLGCYPINYGNKHTDHLNPHKVHPALQKDEKYQNQSEMRAIWEPKEEPEEPLFIKVPKARKYCRPFKP